MVTTLNKALYTAEASTTGGRDGHARSSDGVLDLDIRVPEAMGGHGGGTNPEQLFAAGYAACFQSALGEFDVAIPGVDADTAQELADAAHQVCPYSNATRGNIEVTVKVAS